MVQGLGKPAFASHIDLELRRTGQFGLWKLVVGAFLFKCSNIQTQLLISSSQTGILLLNTNFYTNNNIFQKDLKVTFTLAFLLLCA